MKLLSHIRPALAVSCPDTQRVVVMAPAFADVPKAATVVIDNFSFTPAQLSVAAGATVTWENRDDIPHTIVERCNAAQFQITASGFRREVLADVRETRNISRISARCIRT